MAEISVILQSGRLVRILVLFLPVLLKAQPGRWYSMLISGESLECEGAWSSGRSDGCPPRP